ncbi:hypothetical protein SAMD00019534_047960, partial [Acytostelium subglobosum LB1]|uniref:hypothetical protein n=1 Tax=Acytostelium subglobosum LB1 TaxID=1410327 RepID=UPI000644E418
LVIPKNIGGWTFTVEVINKVPYQVTRYLAFVLLVNIPHSTHHCVKLVNRSTHNFL